MCIHIHFSHGTMTVQTTVNFFMCVTERLSKYIYTYVNLIHHTYLSSGMAHSGFEV